MLCKSVPPLPGSKRVQNEPIYKRDFNTKIATIKISKRCPQGQGSSALPSLRAARAKRVRLYGQPGFPSLRVARDGSLAHVPKLICFGNNCALRSRSLTNALAAPGAAALRALRASQGRALRATVRLRMCQSCFALATPERFEAEAWLSRCMREGGLRKFGSKCCGRSLARCRSWRSAGPARQTLNRALARSLAHVPKLICFGDISTLRRRRVTNVWRR